MTECLRELLEISDKYSDGSYTSNRNRKHELYQWFHDWIVEVQSQQLIARPELVTSELFDHIKTQLVANMSDTLLEHSVYVDDSPTTTVGGRNIKTTVYALRRKKK
jgi:hypothetical protein